MEELMERSRCLQHGMLPMKTCMLLSASLLWGVATNALCQEPVVSDPVALMPATTLQRIVDQTECSWSENDAQCDCQIHWGTYRNGYLWENYCFEKRQCLPLAGCRQRARSQVVCQADDSCERSCAMRPGRRAGAGESTAARTDHLL